MASPDFVQKSSIEISSGAVASATLTGVTTGNTLVALIVQTGAAFRTYSVADDNSDSWSTPQSSDPAQARQCLLAYVVSATGGTTTITATASGDASFYLQVVEIESSTFGAISSFSLASNTTSHYAAAVGEIDAASNAIIIAVGSHNSTAGTLTESNTLIDVIASGWGLTQYVRSDAGFVDERSSWTTTTARQNYGVSASFIAAGGGQTVNLGVASEVATAVGLAVVNPRTYELGIASEVDLGLGLTAGVDQTISLGVTYEVDAALSISVGSDQTITLGLVAESNSVPSLVVSNPRTYSLDVATEVDTAVGLSVGVGQSVSLGIARESNSTIGLAVINPRTYHFGVASEVSTSLPLSIVNPRTYMLGLAEETDIALGVSVSNGDQQSKAFLYYYLQV